MGIALYVCAPLGYNETFQQIRCRALSPHITRRPSRHVSTCIRFSNMVTPADTIRS